jgi:hypothetical protein
VDHGQITPAELNEIYNRCYAGISLSFTNVSLVTQEMIAAGCIPVVNESAEIRMDLKSPYVRYVSPYPHALAAELESLLETPDLPTLSEEAAASVSSISWENAGSTVDVILRRALKADSPVAVSTAPQAL